MFQPISPWCRSQEAIRTRTLLLILLCPAMLAQSRNPEIAPSANLQRSAPPSVVSELTPEEVAEQQHYNQPLRPQFHYTALQGHIGDATGLFFYRGEYHLFNIYDEWARKSSVHKRWGHAISTDLIHWTQMPPVLDTTIDHLPGSGSGVVDWNNSSGLRNGLEKTVLIFYTDYKKGSCILYSNDRGRRWVRYEGNPILRGFEDIRDPNVFWYSAGQEWRMVRYEKKGFVFYGSRDLLHWRWLSRIEGFYECPDLFELPVQNSSADYRWILVDGDGSYVVGQFDGTRFVADSPKLRAEYGTALYATQTWKNSGSSSGPIQIAWLKYPKQSMLTWDGQMSFPVELSLRRLPEGIRLIRQPIGAIQELWSSQRTWSGLEVTSEEQQLPGLESQLLDLTLVMESKGATEFGLKIHGQEIRYSTKQQMLYVDSASAPLALEGGQLHLRILVDRSSLEVFTYPGAVSISTVTLTHADEPITLISRDGSATIVSLLANSLESIWPPQRSNPQSKLWP